MEDAQILLWAKLGFIFFIFTTTMVSSYLPWVIQRRFKADVSAKIIAIGCCFTAGIIIGAGFSHLLPDAIETWENYFYDEQKGTFTYDGYPWASLLSIFTMFVLLWIDKVFVDKGVEGEDHGEHNHNHMVIDLEPVKKHHKHEKHHHERKEDKAIIVAQDDDTHHRHGHSIAITTKEEQYNYHLYSSNELEKGEKGGSTGIYTIMIYIIMHEERPID